LPELSIHSAALKVGRVILTTANPKVSEESLSQFARSQGAEVPGLVAVAPDETAGPIPQTAHTQNILHGLMGGQRTTSVEHRGSSRSEYLGSADGEHAWPAHGEFPRPAHSKWSWSPADNAHSNKHRAGCFGSQAVD
jgi:hypothetical protein